MVSIGLAALGCFPERALSSYREGSGVAPSVAISSTRAADAGASLGQPEVMSEPLPLDAGRSGGEARELADSGSVDAAPARALECRPECSCERRFDRDFMFCGTPVAFAVAEARCAAAGGALASIDDAEQNAWLTEQMAAIDADDFWLSGTDEATEGVWRWADGRVFFDPEGDAGAAFAPWEPGQPNDLNGEDCMRSVGGIWRDLDCSELINYACQG